MKANTSLNQYFFCEEEFRTELGANFRAVELEEINSYKEHVSMFVLNKKISRIEGLGAIINVDEIVEIDDPQIHTLKKVERIEDQWIFIKKYIPGIKLSRLIDQKDAVRLDDNITLYIFREICAVLSSLLPDLSEIGIEFFGLVHPKNVTLTPQGEIKLDNYFFGKLLQNLSIKKGDFSEFYGNYLPTQNKNHILFGPEIDLIQLGLLFLELVTGKKVPRNLSPPKMERYINEAPIKNEFKEFIKKAAQISLFGNFLSLHELFESFRADILESGKYLIASKEFLAVAANLKSLFESSARVLYDEEKKVYPSISVTSPPDIPDIEEPPEEAPEESEPEEFVIKEPPAQEEKLIEDEIKIETEIPAPEEGPPPGVETPAEAGAPIEEEVPVGEKPVDIEERVEEEIQIETEEELPIIAEPPIEEEAPQEEMPPIEMESIQEEEKVVEPDEPEQPVFEADGFLETKEEAEETAPPPEEPEEEEFAFGLEDNEKPKKKTKPPLAGRKFVYIGGGAVILIAVIILITQLISNKPEGPPAPVTAPLVFEKLEGIPYEQLRITLDGSPVSLEQIEPLNIPLGAHSLVFSKGGVIFTKEIQSQEGLTTNVFIPLFPLQITILPGGEVWEGDNRITESHSSHVLYLLPSEYNFSFRQEGYIEEARTITVQENRPPESLEIDLQRVPPTAPGVLVIQMLPSGSVYEGNRLLATFPPMQQNINLSPGRHSLRFSTIEQGCEDQPRTFLIQSGETQSITIQMCFGFLNLNTNPPGASITIDNSEVDMEGIPYGTTPKANIRLPAGLHVLRLQHQNYPEKTVQLIIKKNETINRSIDLRTE